MKALFILFALLLAFIMFLALSCGNPIDYSKMQSREIPLDSTFSGKLQGTIEFQAGTYLIAVEYLGKGTFSISRWYPDNFILSFPLYSGMEKITSWVEVRDGIYDYEIETDGIITIHKIIIYQ